MRITRDGKVVVGIITVCVLAAALWPLGTSNAARELSSRGPQAVGPALPPLALLEDGEAARLSSVAAADNPTRRRTKEAYGKLPLSFEANQGQMDSRVRFLSRGNGYNLFLTSTEAVLALQQSRSRRLTSAPADQTPSKTTNEVLRMKLVGANPTPKVDGSDQLPGKSNYFIGNNPKNWRTNVSTFARVHYREVYPGVDVVYYGNQQQLENDFIVAPGTNPGMIALRFDGAHKIWVDGEGSLVLDPGNGASGNVRLRKPVIYQLIDGARREVAGNYVMRNRREVGFEVADYDLTKPLVIDPVLVYSTYLGGNHAESDWAITVDSSGSAYVVGTTASTDFPGAAPPQHGFDDVTVVKFNAAGSALIYSTYLGGSQSESGYDIAVDSGGDAYVTGKTTSPNFPVVNALKSTYSGGTDEDAFVTRINAAGSALVYSTYLAGQFGARGWGIAATGSQGFAYVTGTTSINFPVTAGAFESTNFNSGFLTKLCTNCSGASSLVYSTFLAHSGSGEGRSVAADVGGNVYLTGKVFSNSTNFATPGAFQTTYGGGAADAFVAKFNTNLSGPAALIYATYLGGSGKDIGGNDAASSSGRAIAIDASGNAYITGTTGSSTDFPLANASQGVIGGQNDAFLTKLNATGSALIYSTYLGGSGDDFGLSVAVNVAGGAYVTGAAGPNFPTVNTLLTPQASVGFVTKFTPAGAVVYSTLLSGVTASTGSFGLAVDDAGNAFATGGTNASIVTTAGAFQTDAGLGGTVGWVTVIADPTIMGRVTDENGNPISGATINLTGVPSATVTTDGSGGYTFGLLSTGNSYTVSVAVSGYIFNSSAVNNLQKNVRRDFGPVVVAISGQVTQKTNPLSGVTMTLSGGKALSTATDALGNYTINNLPAGRNYTVTPTISFSQFVPTSTSFTNISAGQTANFVASANPLDNPDARFFVSQHYSDFLNRSPDQSGLDFWTNQITVCGTDQACIDIRRINVSAAFFLSIEFQQTGYVVERLYKVSYADGDGTSTSPAPHQLKVPIVRFSEFLTDTQQIGQGVIVGQGNWQQQLEDNKAAFALGFVQRSRFTAAFPTTQTPAQFVDRLFLNAGLTPSTTDRTTAINEFSGAGDSSSAIARSKALRDVAENVTFTANEFNRAFVLMQYFGYLRRNPNDPQDSDYTGYDFWLTKLNQFNGNYINAEMIKAFLSSIEYRQRFGS